MNIQVEGLDKLERDLRLIKDRATANKLNRFCLDSAQTLADLIRPSAPVGKLSKAPGTLRKGIRAFKARSRSNYIAGAISWIDRNIAPHVHLVAFGTKAHEIKPKSKKAIRERGTASEFIFAHVKHPGAKANTFFQGTIQRYAPRIVVDLAERIAEFMVPR